MYIIKRLCKRRVKFYIRDILRKVTGNDQKGRCQMVGTNTNKQNRQLVNTKESLFEKSFITSQNDLTRYITEV